MLWLNHVSCQRQFGLRICRDIVLYIQILVFWLLNYLFYFHVTLLIWVSIQALHRLEDTDEGQSSFVSYLVVFCHCPVSATCPLASLSPFVYLVSVSVCLLSLGSVQVCSCCLVMFLCFRPWLQLLVTLCCWTPDPAWILCSIIWNVFVSAHGSRKIT